MNEYTLLKVADGQDEVILYMSRAVAKPKRELPPNGYERAGRDGELGKLSSQWLDDPVYRAQCAAFHLCTSVVLPDDTRGFITEADCRQIKRAPCKGKNCGSTDDHHSVKCYLEYGDAVSSAPAPLETQASGAAVAPTQPAAASPWRNGSEIQRSERTGLWFVRGNESISLASPSYELMFISEAEYRPAPDDAKEGDEYDELRYWQENTGRQPALGGMLVDVRFVNGDCEREPARGWYWGRATLTSTITHWRLSREA